MRFSPAHPWFRKQMKEKQPTDLLAMSSLNLALSKLRLKQELSSGASPVLTVVGPQKWCNAIINGNTVCHHM